MTDETLTVECRLERLASVADLARRIAAPVVGAEAAALIDLAVTEICSNIVRHGHPDDPDHQYAVRVRALNDAIEIEIRDAGPAFAFTKPPMPSVDVAVSDLPEGGFGISLVASTMDAFEQRREGGVNITRVVKRRP